MRDAPDEPRDLQVKRSEDRASLPQRPRDPWGAAIVQRASRDPTELGFGLVPRSMSRQIAVRLPDELVDFIDAEVSAGRSPSRAAVVSQSLHRAHRLRLAERDAAILAAESVDPDMNSLASFAATTPLEDLE